jgi:tight adherence protein C
MQGNVSSINNSSTNSSPLFGFLTRGFAGMLPDFLASKARRDMWRCGFLHPQAYENYLALRNFLFCAVVLTTVFWMVALQDEPHISRIALLVGLIAAVVLYALPRVYFSMLGEARARRVVSSLPDGLDVLAMAMSGGLPFHRALEHSVVELNLAHPDLATELALIGRQSGAGSLEYSLQRFAERIDMDESTSVVESLSQAVHLGSPLRSILESLADRMRKERMQRATEKANKNALKMLFPTVLCLVPAAFLIVMMPPLLKLKEFRVNSNQEGGALSQRDVSSSSTPNPRGNASPSP